MSHGFDGNPTRRPASRRPGFGVRRRGSFRESAARATSRHLPYLDDGMLDVDQGPPVVRSVQAPPPPKRPVEIPEQILRIFVGDLAPQVSGALNVVQTNELANGAAALGAVALGALAIPAALSR